MRYQAFIFDVGGTMLYGEPSDITLLTQFIRKQGVQIDSDTLRQTYKLAKLKHAEQCKLIYQYCHSGKAQQEYPTYHSIVARELSIIAGCNISESNIDDCFESVRHNRKWILIESNLHSTLTSIREKGLSLGVVSNWEAGLGNVLAEVGIGQFFNVVISSSDVGIQKPDPRIFLKACESLGVVAESCLYIGDMALDVLGSLEAGMDVALVGTHADDSVEELSIEPTYRIKVASDVLELIQ